MNTRIGTQSQGRYDEWIEWCAEMERVLDGWARTGLATTLVRMLIRLERLYVMNPAMYWDVPRHVLADAERHADSIARITNATVAILERGKMPHDDKQLQGFVAELVVIRQWLQKHNKPVESGIKY